jgi:transcriptional regulator with XRE-family HTH domain
LIVQSLEYILNDQRKQYLKDRNIPMAPITREQCRAARALLDWQQTDLIKNSRVSKKAIVDFERGYTTPWPRTLDDLRRTFEAAGIEFIGNDGNGGIGVRMRDGFEAITRTATREGRSTSSEGGVEASSWDYDFEDFATDQPVAPYFIPISDADRANLRQYFADPERWNKLSDRAKAVYRRELGLSNTLGTL